VTELWENEVETDGMEARVSSSNKAAEHLLRRINFLSLICSERLVLAESRARLHFGSSLGSVTRRVE
jgi:hypothetical protein